MMLIPCYDDSIKQALWGGRNKKNLNRKLRWRFVIEQTVEPHKYEG
jgi:hypothetical protein